MSEPSMETVEKARAILDTSGDYLDRLELIAVALQQLMDERDAWQGTVDQLNSTCALWTKRAEAAEARVKELMDERAAAGEVAHSWMVETLAATKRAEAAEAKLRDVYEGNEPNPIHAAEALQAAAEAKLAELVRRVREWMGPDIDHCSGPGWEMLFAILSEYEPIKDGAK